MTYLKSVVLALLALTLTGCFNDSDDKAINQDEIKDFIYQGMNAAYLYKDFIKALETNKSKQDGYNDYLNSFSSPEDLFESLVYNRESVDRFSWITDNYIDLEKMFQGESLSNGMDFRLIRYPENSNTVVGYVRYVAKGSTAEAAGLKRGDLFTSVNGTAITANNYYGLLIQPDSYTLDLADYQGKNVTPNGTSITVSKTKFTENPILINKTLDVEGNKVGYLMYNGFTGTDTFDSNLNAVFGQFKSEGISDLVLDLRYNPGGSVRTAVWLCSMITGNFTGQTLLKQQWNSELQAQFEQEDPNGLIYPFETKMIKKYTNGEVYFDEDINHLNLNRLYVLTTKGTASASELIINGLKPYIEVIQIGDDTTGKFQASVTLYDSQDFTRKNANPRHTYALQPLIFKSLNKDGVTDYSNGLKPNVKIKEEFYNLGTLGDVNEPLLKEALAKITNTFTSHRKTIIHFDEITTSKDNVPYSKEMYIEASKLQLLR